MSTTQEAFSDFKDPSLFRNILEQSLAGFWIWNTQTREAYLSPSFKALFGYEELELEGSAETWQKLVHPQDAHLIEKAIGDHISSNGEIPFKENARYLHKNGSSVWIQCTGKITQRDEEGNPLIISGAHIDISEYKTQESHLKISEERFKGAFEHSAIGMALVSTKGRWLKVNNKVSQILGYTKDELLKTTFQDVTHPDDLNLDVNQLGQMLAGEIKTYQMEKRYFHKTGKTVWVNLSVSLVRDTDGLPLHFVSQIEDITLRKESLQKLEAAITEKEGLNLKLKKQNTKLADFAHIASHNLRAPVSNLQALMNMHKLLEAGQERDEIFGKFEVVLEHLTETLNELVDAVRINNEAKEARLVPLSFSSVFERTKQILSGDILNKKAHIEGDFSEAPEVKYLPSYLESIFLNLISNALKYSSPNRIPSITVYSRINDGRVSLHVKDNGLGVDLEKQGAKLFGLRKTFHKNKDAKGIGLFMTKTQVEALGGRIYAQSEVDKGSTFSIDFNDA